VRHIEAHFEIAPDAERAIEIDPRVTGAEHIELLHRHRFRRFSLGVQDFDPGVQAAIGRTQSFELTREVVELCRRQAGSSINLDLIYGLPGQTPERFSATLDAVQTLRPERLAVYGFAFVPWLKKTQTQMPLETLPGPGQRLGLLALARERLLAAGYVDIGIDHFALPDDELVVAQANGRLSRNFMGYTVKRAPHMLAFGVSGISEVAGVYAQNVKKLSEYYAAIEAGRLPVERGILLDDDDRTRGWLIREILCNFAVDGAEFERERGVPFERHFADELARLQPMVDEGYVTWDHRWLRVIGDGRYLARNVAMVFDGHLSRRGAASGRFSRTV
jgi:oxygen-independent coproporphyrinogen-3 oxidase